MLCNGFSVLFHLFASQCEEEIRSKLEAYSLQSLKKSSNIKKTAGILQF